MGIRSKNAGSEGKYYATGTLRTRANTIYDNRGRIEIEMMKKNCHQLWSIVLLHRFKRHSRSSVLISI